jgi:hypothetical protein
LVHEKNLKKIFGKQPYPPIGYLDEIGPGDTGEAPIYAVKYRGGRTAGGRYKVF